MRFSMMVVIVFSRCVRVCVTRFRAQFVAIVYLGICVCYPQALVVTSHGHIDLRNICEIFLPSQSSFHTQKKKKTWRPFFWFRVCVTPCV